MGSNQVHYLIVPGWHGSEDGHWQSHWARSLPQAKRVQQRDWVNPSREEWVDTLSQHIRNIPGQIVLIAHSLGCVAVAHWASRAESGLLAKISGALLVAPADVERVQCPPALAGFAPVPMQPLPFASVLVGSSNDSAATAERTYALGHAWGAQVTVLPDAGHINVKSGHGAWEAGFRYLYQLQALIERRAHQPKRKPSCWWAQESPRSSSGFAVSY